MLSTRPGLCERQVMLSTRQITIQMDSVVCFANTDPLDSYLSGG